MLIIGSIDHIPKEFGVFPHELSKMKLEDCVGVIRVNKDTKPEITKKFMRLEPHSIKIDKIWSVRGRK